MPLKRLRHTTFKTGIQFPSQPIPCFRYIASRRAQRSPARHLRLRPHGETLRTPARCAAHCAFRFLHGPRRFRFVRRLGHLAAQAHWQRNWIYDANLAYGVTTTRDPQTSSTDVLTYQDRVDAGLMTGPRIYSTGPGVFSNDRVGSLEAARTVLKRYSDYYDTKTFKMYMAGNRQTRQYLIMAARELKLMPTTEGGLQFALNMTHAMDGYSGVEHTIPLYPMFDDVVHCSRRRAP